MTKQQNEVNALTLFLFVQTVFGEVTGVDAFTKAERLVTSLSDYMKADDEVLKPLIEVCHLQSPLLESEWRDVQARAKALGITALAKKMVQIRAERGEVYQALAQQGSL